MALPSDYDFIDQDNLQQDLDRAGGSDLFSELQGGMEAKLEDLKGERTRLQVPTFPFDNCRELLVVTNPNLKFDQIHFISCHLFPFPSSIRPNGFCRSPWTSSRPNTPLPPSIWATVKATLSLQENETKDLMIPDGEEILELAGVLDRLKGEALKMDAGESSGEALRDQFALALREV